MAKKKYTFIDLFAGCGGLSEGFLRTGRFNALAHVEWEKPMVETLRNRLVTKWNESEENAKKKVILFDIQKTEELINGNWSDESIAQYGEHNSGKVRKSGLKGVIGNKLVDLIIGGPPCQAYSIHGRATDKDSMNNDYRNYLFESFCRVVDEFRPNVFVFENVPGITSKMSSRGGKTLIVDILKKEMMAAGYTNFIEVVLDASKFGVPQNRKRYFVLGTRLGGKRLLHPISRLKRTYSVADAFEGLPSVVPNTWIEGREYQPFNGEYASLMRDEQFWRCGQSLTEHISYHMPMKHRPATLERFSLLQAGESLRDLFARYSGDALRELQSRHVLPNKIFIKRNYRLPLKSPSPTVTSHCLDEFVHPMENRALTVRECARLQSFPDSYDFAGGPYIVPHINRDVQDKYEQIGDAVPPLLAYAWGKTIFKMLMED